MKPSRLALFALPLVLLLTGLSPAPAALASQACGGSGTMTSLSGALPDGATYLIQCPAVRWNGTLLLYSHGYVAPGSPNPAEDVGDPVTGTWLLSHGFALAGSSYASTGWAIQQALPDQIDSARQVQASLVGTPDRTIAWGHSLGGIITAGLIQSYPNRFNAALPMCGVLSGGVGHLEHRRWTRSSLSTHCWRSGSDCRLVNITNPFANLADRRSGSSTAAQQTRRRAGRGSLWRRRSAIRRAGMIRCRPSPLWLLIRHAGSQPVSVAHAKSTFLLDSTSGLNWRDARAGTRRGTRA